MNDQPKLNDYHVTIKNAEGVLFTQHCIAVSETMVRERYAEIYPNCEIESIEVQP